MLGFQVVISNHVRLLPQQEEGQAERIELMRPSPAWTVHGLILTLISAQVLALNIQAASGHLCPPKCLNRPKSQLVVLEHTEKNVDSGQK